MHVTPMLKIPDARTPTDATKNGQWSVDDSREAGPTTPKDTVHVLYARNNPDFQKQVVSSVAHVSHSTISPDRQTSKWDIGLFCSCDFMPYRVGAFWAFHGKQTPHDSATQRRLAASRVEEAEEIHPYAAAFGHSVL